jgi:rare lipoprotein A
MTAAHPTLPIGSRVRIARGGTSVVVVITDRFCHPRRGFDLSRAAAERLGMIDRGVASIRWARVTHRHR